MSLTLFFLVLAFFLSAWLTTPDRAGRAQNSRTRANKPASVSVGCCDQKTWAQKSTTGPSPRATALAYDQVRQKTVLFGGYTSTSPGMDDQTWLWDGSTWTQVSPATKPTKRRSHNLAYDSDRQVTVLFGGDDITGNLRKDTWEWNGTNWTQRSSSGPSPRENYAMTYDSQRHVTLLFGGETGSGYAGDTWEWNGVTGTWTQKSTTGPSPRGYPRMTYDPVRNVTVLFGGGDNIGPKDDTWEWNGASSTWSPIATVGSPPARAGHGMAYDSACGVVIFGGGDTNNNNLGDTWSWDGTSWSLRSNTGPSARTGPGMAYDNARNAMVVFGGYYNPGVNGYFNNTWEWSGGGSVAGADLWMKDTMAPDLPEDFGVEPTISQTLFISRDIWVRDNPDTPVTSVNPGPDTTSPSDRYYANEHLHQDPTYVNAATPSYVYVKVRNRGCAASTGTEKLHVYWVDAATGSPWPSSWNEIDCVTGGGVNPCPLPVIAPGQDYVVQLPWVPPDPAAFSGHDHFCLLARIETQPSYPFGMTSAETSWVAQNVADNNNIVWKNLTVFTSTSGKGHLIVRNTLRNEARLELRFEVPATELKNHFLLHGDIFVNLGDALMKKWKRGGQRMQGFIVVDERTIKITDPTNVVLGGLLFAPGEEQTIEVRMQLKPGDRTPPGTSFNWDVIQTTPQTTNAKPSAIGGERYTLIIPRAAERKDVRKR